MSKDAMKLAVCDRSEDSGGFTCGENSDNDDSPFGGPDKEFTPYAAARCTAKTRVNTGFDM